MNQAPTDPKDTLAKRLAEADLSTRRFIDVHDGEKRSTDHTLREPSTVRGNYGIYPGRGLVDIDIDDYGEGTDAAGIDAILDLPDTLTVQTPHTDGEPGGHRYYHVTTDRTVDEFDVDSVLSRYIDEEDGPTATYEAAKDDPVALTLAETFGTSNPQPSWGEVRAVNQYVVGPGSQIDGCDKEWCDACVTPDGGRYTIATDRAIATITAADLVDALRTDPELTGLEAGADSDSSSSETVPTSENYEPDGTTFKEVIRNDRRLATYLAAGAKAAEFEANDGGGDRSAADWYACCTAIKHGVGEAAVRERLTECSHSKVGARDADRGYWLRTWSNAVADVDEPNAKAPIDADGSTNPTIAKFIAACERYQIDPKAVATTKRDAEKIDLGVETIIPESSIEDAVFAFKRKAGCLDGVEKQAVIGYVILLDLKDRGEFFKTAAGKLYYFHEPETHVYRVGATGRRVLTEDFQAFVWERYNLFAGSFSRNLGKDIKNQARRHAPERAVYRFAHFDGAAGELYINDYDDGYYAVSPEAIAWRPNGTDVFFLPNDRAEPYDYLDADRRNELPAEIPGERDLWAGSGDPMMRLFGNRINYDEDAALGPSDQRHQLYIHLHTLPFIDLLNARPIMAWAGEKGSGKTVLQRSIGRFIFGEEFTESIMPDSKDDFLAKVSNQALAFLDNYDDGVEWANDILAAVATGAGIDQRELYTTNSLRQEVPRCWLSLTSRDPPFRRDDVADRTLVFRVERVENGFVGMGDYLRQVTAYRNHLWSVYLDNLQAIVQEHHRRDTETMSSDHRMADWAIFARIVGDALGLGDIDELLATMETERATFALENEPWARVLGQWIQANPDHAAEYRSAGDLGDELETHAAENDLPDIVTHAAGLGSKLVTYRNELGELYDLEIDDSGRSNAYRFATGDHNPTGLGRFH